MKVMLYRRHFVAGDLHLLKPVLNLTFYVAHRFQGMMMMDFGRHYLNSMEVDWEFLLADAKLMESPPFLHLLLVN